MEIFDRIGDEIEEEWRRANYNEAEFPSLAADALGQAEIPSKTNVWQMAEWALGQTELPRQRDVSASFGEPPVTVYSGPRFHIDVYFWFNGTTSIHQHGFCGAFQVLEGSSIHSWYEFECENKINTFTEIGRISLKMCELLEVGAVQQILPGKQYIHSLFHLDHPSATIVIRTDRSPLDLPQYNYHKPGLAIDPFMQQETSIKKRQIAAACVKAKHPDADRWITKLIGDSDLQTTFDLLTSLRHLVRTDTLGEMFDVGDRTSRFDSYLAAAEQRHGDDGVMLRRVFERQAMTDHLIALRTFVTDGEHRFFLALLMNVDGLGNICRLISQRFADKDPLEKLLDWTYDLATTRFSGPDRANALGIADFGDLDISVLEQMLRGHRGSDIIRALSDQLGPTPDAMAEAIAEKEKRITEADIFRPLFA